VAVDGSDPMSPPEPTIADVLAAIARLRTELMARIGRLQDTVDQRGRDIAALLERSGEGR
jgi:hypothetical protein